MSPTERTLRLLALLQDGRQWPAADLAAATGTPPRTLRRDVEQLRSLGYPIVGTRGPGGHYRLAPGAALPPLLLDDDEAAAVALSLVTAASGGTGLEFPTDAAVRALEKLRAVLPARLRPRADEIRGAVEIATVEHRQPSSAALSVLATAATRHHRVEFEYRNGADAEVRTVEPYRLVRSRRRWYLFAWDGTRGDWRSFRLDRMAAVRRLPQTFRPRPMPAGGVTSHWDRLRSGAALEVVVVLHTDAADAASRLHRIDGRIEPIDELSCRYVAEVDSFEWLTTVLVVAGIEFRVEHPQAFAEYLALAAGRLQRAAAGASRATEPAATQPAATQSAQAVAASSSAAAGSATSMP